MTAIVEQWMSLTDFLRHVAASGSKVLGNNRSQHTDIDFLGAADVPTFLEHCRTLQRADFPARAQQIDRLAETLVGELPAGVSVRRQPVWGRQGSSVNVHKVMRGDLSHAWRRTVRQVTRSPGGQLTVLNAWNASFSISHTQIIWTAIATLALADYARRLGRRVELWCLGWNVQAFRNGRDYIAGVRLVHAGASWDTSAVVLKTYPEWLRRLKFRAIEMASTQAGGMINGSYGVPQQAGEMLAWARDTWAPTQGLAPESVVLGCTQADHVTTRERAQRWVQERLAGLAPA